MASDWLKAILHSLSNHPKALRPTGSDSQDCRGIFADIENTHGKVEG
jgi:hypothetical protein